MVGHQLASIPGGQLLTVARSIAAEWPMAEFSGLEDYGRVPTALAIPMATLQLYVRFVCPSLQTRPRRSRWRLCLR